ncbi:ATP/GTP-binding protein [Streptomyces sp. NPDC048448]|uniref:ATP/GTP-binding protein n=1 Tax=Streptomyces sp. NPDC048448 TaxID=3365554 RepID=UPI0037202FDF
MLNHALGSLGAALLLATVATTTAGTPGPKPSTGVGSCTVVEICVGAGVGGTPGSGNDKPTHPGKGTGKPPVPGPCIVTRMEPQPPTGSSVWEGHDPGDGAIYTRICPVAIAGAGATGSLMGPPETFWSATPPAPTIDPAQLAQQALDKMALLGPDITSPDPAGKYIVGLPTWMWVTKRQTTYGPNTASASAGGVTVTATATVSKIVWGMGDGSTVTCNGPGTPYTASYGNQESPTCGHTYSRTSASQDDGKYTVTATSTWSVDWQVVSGGETGQLTAIRQSQEQVAIGELQVVK